MKKLRKKEYMVIGLMISIVLALSHIAYAEGGMITGKVTRSDGETPIGGVRVAAYREAESYQPGYLGTARTDAKGKYIIKHIVSGEYTVVATHSGYVDSTKYNISVADKKVTKNINFTLFEEATISGKVTEMDGATPIPGATVSIDGSDKIPKGGDITDEEGKYKINQILPDKYWIRAIKDGYAMEVTLPTPIEEGQKVTDFNFKLEKAASISGKIMIENTSTPVEGAIIFAVLENRVYDYKVADEQGDYLLQGLASGSYQIIIRHENYTPFLYEISVTTGEVITNKNFYLKPSK